MLSKEDNDILTQVGQGTPMGDLMRRFWIPAMLASEVAEPDGAPKRFRLLGEDLMAFRNTDGVVGILDEFCPHRRSSLALGVNADNGVRCLYHGWKFGVDGECVDTPAEPPGASMVGRVRAKSYPAREVAGVIWTYMGPAENEPVFPEFEWMKYPEGHCVPFKVLEDCNYAQAVEGTIDSAHAGVLHRESPWGQPAKYEHEKDLSPKLEVEYTKYGLRYGAVRKLVDEGKLHARVTEVVLPFFTLIPPDGFGVRKNRRMANAFVPRDDVSTWHIQWFFDDSTPIDVEYRIKEGGHYVDENFRKLRNIDNWYLQDRQMMKTTNMSGIEGILIQDHAVSESQGRILDRTKEHLGGSDVAVVAWRRQMIRAARAFAKDGAIPAVLGNDVPWSKIRSATVRFPDTSNWKAEVPLNPESALS